MRYKIKQKYIAEFSTIVEANSVKEAIELYYDGPSQLELEEVLDSYGLPKVFKLIKKKLLPFK